MGLLAVAGLVVFVLIVGSHGRSADGNRRIARLHPPLGRHIAWLAARIAPGVPVTIS